MKFNLQKMPSKTKRLVKYIILYYFNWTEFLRIKLEL